MTEDFSVGMHIKRLHELMTLKANQMFRRYDLTLSQTMILVHCVEQKTEYVMQKELETTFGLSHATISGLLKRLSENGFLAVCISEEDKRQRKVYLTKKAQRMAEQLQQGGNCLEKMITSHFSQHEVERIKFFLQTMYDNLLTVESNDIEERNEET